MSSKEMLPEKRSERSLATARSGILGVPVEKLSALLKIVNPRRDRPVTAGVNGKDKAGVIKEMKAILAQKDIPVDDMGWASRQITQIRGWSRDSKENKALELRTLTLGSRIYGKFYGVNMNDPRLIGGRLRLILDQEVGVADDVLEWSIHVIRQVGGWRESTDKNGILRRCTLVRNKCNAGARLRKNLVDRVGRPDSEVMPGESDDELIGPIRKNPGAYPKEVVALAVALDRVSNTYGLPIGMRSPLLAAQERKRLVQRETKRLGLSAEQVEELEISLLPRLSKADVQALQYSKQKRLEDKTKKK